MIRSIFALIIILVVYYALKTVFQAAMRSYHEEPRASTRARGEEMVLDPECRTYVIKDRALTRRIQGKTISFCSEACAARYAEKHRG